MLESLPPTVEQFRQRFGRDPATDTEMEFYYTRPALPPDWEERPELGPVESQQSYGKGTLHRKPFRIEDFFHSGNYHYNKDSGPY